MSTNVQETAMSLQDFLKNRGISLRTIEYFGRENIDCEAVCSMSEEELKDLIPTYGDRVALRNFAKRSISTPKHSLIERLKAKMEERSERSPRKTPTSPNTKVKQTRIIEIGWFLMYKKENRYRQVRAPNGGGTRRVSIDKASRCSEVLKMAKKLFFPGGVSTKGPITDFHVELVDYKSHSFDQNLTIQEMYEMAALPTLRFYLATTKKTEDDAENDDDFIPATQTSTRMRSNNFVEPTHRLSERVLPSTTSTVSQRIDNNGSLPLATVAVSESNIEEPTGTFFRNFNPDDIYGNSDYDTTLFGMLEEIPQLRDEQQFIITLHRGHVFEDLMQAAAGDLNRDFKIQMILPNGQLEAGEDFGGVFRDALSEFWNQFFEKCTVGTTVKVPYIRHDFGEKEWSSIVKILIRGFEMVKYFPIQLSEVFLKSCYGKNVGDEELVKDFYNFICESYRILLREAVNDFDNADLEELLEFFNLYESKWIPSKQNINTLIRDIAHKELIQKPSFVVKCFNNHLQNSSISFDEICSLYTKLRPTIKNCLAQISTQEVELNAEQNTVFSYIKKFLRESDEKVRQAFFRFSTGADLPIMKISVEFSNTTGIQRMPIAHTCSGQLQISTNYEDYIDFRSEMNSVLASNIWIMDII